MRLTSVFHCRLRRVFAFLVFSVFVLLVGMYKHATETTLGEPDHMVFLNDFYQESCSIPLVEPYHPSIRSAIWKPAPLVCDPTPSIVFVDETNTLHLNRGAFAHFGVTSDSDVKCTAQNVTRLDEAHVVFGNESILRFPAKLSTEFNLVSCTHGWTPVYDNIVAGIASPRPTAPAMEPEFKDETDDQLSVHLIGLDSVSTAAAIRGLPVTLDYLRTLGSYEFRGMMKIGENTPPNLVGLLTGRRLWTNETIYGGHVDALPYLWKNFSERHYVTLYAEDCLHTNFLNMNFNGFAKQPTNHYMRPFWLALEKRKFERPGKIARNIVKFLKDDYPRRAFCQQNSKTSMLTTDYLKLFMLHHKQRRKLSFTFLTDVSHESCNNLPYIDQELKDLFQWMKEGGFMEKSVLVFFGDHGPRYDSLRNTYAGRHESRMPLLQILIPEHIKRRFPEVDKSLKINTERLVSLYDVRQTILDVLDQNFNNPSTQYINGTKRGVSLLKPMSSTRSCKDAAIPAEFCACFKSQPINLTNNHEFDQIGPQLVDHINQMLSAERKCRKLSLNRILSVEKRSSGLEYKHTLGSGDKQYIQQDGALIDSYSILIETTPGLAKFDIFYEIGSLERTPNVRNVDRTNKYGNQSHCVQNSRLKQYCYC